MTYKSRFWCCVWFGCGFGDTNRQHEVSVIFWQLGQKKKKKDEIGRNIHSKQISSGLDGIWKESIINTCSVGSIICLHKHPTVFNLLYPITTTTTGRHPYQHHRVFRQNCPIPSPRYPTEVSGACLRTGHTGPLPSRQTGWNHGDGCHPSVSPPGHHSKKVFLSIIWFKTCSYQHNVCLHTILLHWLFLQHNIYYTVRKLTQMSKHTHTQNTASIVCADRGPRPQSEEISLPSHPRIPRQVRESVWVSCCQKGNG